MLCESGIGKQKKTAENNHAQDHKRLLSNSGVANSLLEELQDALPTGLTNSLAQDETSCRLFRFRND